MAEKRKYSQAQNKATQKWEKENYYKVTCKFPKKLELLIKDRAEQLTNGSVNAYLKNLVENDIFNTSVEETTREVFFDAP